MNFLNKESFANSFKQLKNVLAEGLEQKVDFEGTSSEAANETLTHSDGDNESLRKLCQHQNEEVGRNIFFPRTNIIALFVLLYTTSS